MAMVIVCWALLIIWSMLNIYGILEFGHIPIYKWLAVIVYGQMLFFTFFISDMVGIESKIPQILIFLLITEHKDCLVVSLK
jgi:hypothetical protein